MSNSVSGNACAGGNPNQALRDMLKYIETTTDDNVSNQDIASIHNLVAQVKGKKEVGINYMKSWEREEMIRDEGLQEGRRQGQESLLLEQIQKKLTKSQSIDQIADALEEAPEHISELISENNLE